jgi:hypothetical protein
LQGKIILFILFRLLIKYAEEYEKDPSSYETIIVTKIRNILGIVFKVNNSLENIYIGWFLVNFSVKENGNNV